METNKKKTDRLYLRIEPDLKKNMLKYGERHGVALSYLVERFFKKLLVKEKQL